MTATYLIVHRKEIGGSGEGKVNVRSAERFTEKGVKDVMGRARENAKPWEGPQGGRKTNPHSFYYNIVFCSEEVMECTVLREMNLVGREVLSRKALDTKLTKLLKQKWRCRAELARKRAELKKI